MVLLPPPTLPELPELPGITDYNQQVEAHNQRLWQLPLSPEERLEELLACIWSGENLDKVAFQEGQITYPQLWQIDQNTNPQLYSESSQHVDNNYEQPCLEDFDSQDEGEGEEEHPLPTPGSLGTHMRNPPTEHSSGEQSSKSMRESLERHLGTIIEEMFQERNTLESE